MPKRAGKIKTVITAELREGKAYIRIVDAISEYGLASSAEIRSQVDSFLNQGVRTAEVFLSSRGGDCFEAEDIVIELDRFGKENVTIHVGALAASAATYLTSTFKTKANPNSQFMFHRPRLGVYGDIDSIEADLKLLRNATENYIKRYSEKTRKTVEEIAALIAKGDVWMSAKEALEYGFIDEVLGNEDAEITASDLAVLEACGAPVIPEVTTTTENTEMDRKLLIATLGLAADATDEQIIAAAEKAKKDADALAARQENENAVKESRAKQLVAQALKDKRIKAEMVSVYEGLAKDNYESTKAVLEALTPVPQLTKELGSGVQKTTLEARAGWDYAKWMEEDPKGLQALADNDPEEFKKLFN